MTGAELSREGREKVQREARFTANSSLLFASPPVAHVNFLPAGKFNDPAESAWLETVERGISSKMFLCVTYQNL